MMEPAFDGLPRVYTINRSQHLGYGFVAGYESPTMVKSVEQNGPSYKRLLPGDVIMAVNGINVENESRERIIRMIQLCDDQIEIKVRQPTFDEIARARNLNNPKFYAHSKLSNSSPVNHINSSSRQLSSANSSTIMNCHQPSSPLNHLVTSISRQQSHQNINNNHQYLHDHLNGDSSHIVQKPISKTILQQRKLNNGNVEDLASFSRTLNRNHHASSNGGGGRHSPFPQRCKSSMDDTHTSKLGKKAGDNVDNDQHLLKRSNTMRPIKQPKPLPPAKVMEIFEVVLKIFFEVGHYRVLPYNSSTTVGTILEQLNARLIGSSPYSEQIKRYFGLALTVSGVNSQTNVEEKVPIKKQLHILDENDPIINLRRLPYAQKLRLLYRMVYPPSDVSTLYAQDKVAFDYLYHQSCNDLKLQRFCPELDQETALKLSALHLLEYVHSNHARSHNNSKEPKVYIKLIKKTPGLEFFVSSSMASSTLDKKGKRIVNQYNKLKAKLTEQLKKNFEEFDFEPPKVRSTTNLNRYSSTSFHELSLPELQTSSSECIKLLFLNYLSQLPCYGNSRRPSRTSTSPSEKNNGADCSSSLESVPRTSDSSPLIRIERGQNNINNLTGLDNPVMNVTRLAQVNSLRSLNSVQSSSISHHNDQPDMAQTPSIESISSITFNMQNSPSPDQTISYQTQQVDNYPTLARAEISLEPSPMPRQQIISSRPQDLNSVEKLYSARYTFNDKPIEDLLRKVVLLPPPPITNTRYEDLPYQLHSTRYGANQINYLTQVLSDREIEQLRVPPPPRFETLTDGSWKLS